jgi:hypothetical protein
VEKVPFLDISLADRSWQQIFAFRFRLLLTCVNQSQTVLLLSSPGVSRKFRVRLSHVGSTRALLLFRNKAELDSQVCSKRNIIINDVQTIGSFQTYDDPNSAEQSMFSRSAQVDYTLAECVRGRMQRSCWMSGRYNSYATTSPMTSMISTP